MRIRLLVASRDEECASLIGSLLQAALVLVPLDVEVCRVSARVELLRRVALNADDVIFLDWDLAHASTPAVVREVVRSNPRARVVAILPLQLRQYRQKLWEAGAHGSIPKEHLDQEWMSSLLCGVERDMGREARLFGGLTVISPEPGVGSNPWAQDAGSMPVLTRG